MHEGVAILIDVSGRSALSHPRQLIGGAGLLELQKERAQVTHTRGDGYAHLVTVSHFSLSLPPPRLIKALSLSPFHFRQGTYWRAWM